MAIAKGQVLTGKVTGITKFGAFVELESGETGLVHISEVADAFVKDINDFVSVGDEVKVRVLNVDDNGKIGLSMKQGKEREKREKREARETRKKPQRPSLSFDEQISRFMKESDEKQASINRNINAKRRSGNRY